MADSKPTASSKRKTKKKARNSAKKTATGSRATTKTAAGRAGARNSRPAGGTVRPVAPAVWTLQELPEQQQFYLCSGQRLRNLKELAEVLDGMQEEIFRYHVNEQRNDFHTWARDVFHEDALAEELLNAADQRRMQGIIRAYAPDGA